MRRVFSSNTIWRKLLFCGELPSIAFLRYFPFDFGKISLRKAFVTDSQKKNYVFFFFSLNGEYFKNARKKVFDAWMCGNPCQWKMPLMFNCSVYLVGVESNKQHSTTWFYFQFYGDISYFLARFIFHVHISYVRLRAMFNCRTRMERGRDGELRNNDCPLLPPFMPVGVGINCIFRSKSSVQMHKHCKWTLAIWNVYGS